jgi:hypothetical protein
MSIFYLDSCKYLCWEHSGRLHNHKLIQNGHVINYKLTHNPLKIVSYLRSISIEEVNRDD